MRHILRSLSRLSACHHLFRSPASHLARVFSTTAFARQDGASSVVLRDYQEECLQSVLSYVGRGHRRLGISLATGSGKTVIFTQLIDRIPDRSSTGTQTLILAHRRELVQQASRHCANSYPQRTIDIEMGLLKASGAADITIASVASLMSGDRIEKFDPRRFKLILVDEAHHIVAPNYLQVLEHFGLRHKPEVDAPTLVGVSATFSRFDGLKLGAAIDHIVYHKDYLDMIESNWLANAVFTTVRSKAELSSVKNGADGDFQIAALSRAVNTEANNDVVVQSWLNRAKDRVSTLVFCVDIAHVDSLTAHFRAFGIEAMPITSKTHKKVRHERLQAFKNEEFPVLINCGVFTEGTDIPNVDCVLLARPTRSRNLLVQMIGRGMRLHPGKKDCHIIDMVSSLKTGIVTTPTLFGLDPDEIVSGLDANTLQRLQSSRGASSTSEKGTRDSDANAAKPQPGAFQGSVEFTDYESLTDLIDDTSGERHIRAISQHAWVEVSGGRYVLSDSSGSFLMIVQGDEAKSEFTIEFHDRIRGFTTGTSPYKRTKVIATASNFEDAVHAADTFASDRFPRVLIAKDSEWRKRPATEGQVKFLNKFRSGDQQLAPDSVTKGQANEMIAKITHGARGDFQRRAAGQRRAKREVVRHEKLVRLQSNEQVRVGPLVDG